MARESLADRIAAGIGSWRFVGLQSAGLALWVLLNSVAWSHHWDGYPYVFLNLVLSFQAASTGPILLIAAARQEKIHRDQLRYMLHLMETMVAREQEAGHG